MKGKFPSCQGSSPDKLFILMSLHKANSIPLIKKRSSLRISKKSSGGKKKQMRNQHSQTLQGCNVSKLFGDTTSQTVSKKGTATKLMCLAIKMNATNMLDSTFMIQMAHGQTVCKKETATKFICLRSLLSNKCNKYV